MKRALISLGLTEKSLHQTMTRAIMGRLVEDIFVSPTNITFSGVMALLDYFKF